MEQLPKIVRERLQAGAQAGDHPDPDLLTAFAENSLTERERLPVLEHLSNCADCREVVLLAQPELVMEHVAAAAVAASPAPSRPRWSSRLIFSWGAVAACVLIGVALLHYQTREKKFAQIAAKQTAPEVNLGQTSSGEPSPAIAKTQPAASAPENELAAKLEPPVPPQSKTEARADKHSGQAAASRMLARPTAKKLGGLGAASGLTAGALAVRSAPPIPRSSQQVTVTGDAAAISSTTEAQARLPLQSQNTADLQTQDSSAKVTQSLAAAAAPPTAQQQNKPAAIPSSANSARAGAALDSVSAFSLQKSRLETAQAIAYRKEEMARMNSNYIPTRWTISSDGAMLLRSTDEGRSWDAVNVASNVVFRAVAAFGPEVWVGGKGGALYHSTDLGAHWTQVKPTVNGTALTADIVSLDFSNTQNGKLTTAEGKVWTTSDAGKTWQTQ